MFKIQKWFFDDIIWEHSSNLNSLSVFDKKGDKEKQLQGNSILAAAKRAKENGR